MATENVKLNAANSVLRAIGGTLITSLDDPENLQGTLALSAIDDVKREVFLETLWRGLVRKISISPTGTTDELVVPEPNRTLQVWAADPARDNISLRGNRIYNNKTDSFSWDKSLEVYYIYNEEFEDISPALQRYITNRARYSLYMDKIGGAQATYYREEMLKARSVARREDAIRRNPNFIYGSSTSRAIATRRNNTYVDIREYNAHLDPTQNPLR